jgi:hypothetical protein
MMTAQSSRVDSSNVVKLVRGATSVTNVSLVS